MNRTDRFEQRQQALSEAQWKAVGALAAGSTIVEAARLAGVSRQAVSGWRHHHAPFIAALNAAARDQVTGAHAQLLALAPQVVATLAADLDRGGERGSRAARDLARLLVKISPDDTGPTTAEEVEDEWALDTMMAIGPIVARMRAADPH